MKKLLALILTTLMLLSMVAPSFAITATDAAALTAGTIYVQDVEVEPGTTTVTVPVKVINNLGISVANVVVYYDNALTATAVTLSAGMFTTGDMSLGDLNVLPNSSNVISGPLAACGVTNTAIKCISVGLLDNAGIMIDRFGGLKVDGEIFTVTFTLPTGAAGSYEIGVAFGDDGDIGYYNEYYDVLPRVFDHVAGSVRILGDNPPCPHTNTTTVTVDATCTLDGSVTVTCNSCSEIVSTQTLTALGHNYVDVITDPTCIAGGYTTYTCSRCSDFYVDNPTSALGHDMQEVNRTPATCTVDGIINYKCSRCDVTSFDTLTATGHSYTSVVTPATCTLGGYTTYTCSVCSASYTGDATEPTPHNYAAVVTDPTCTLEGYTTYTCADCGASYTGDVTAALGHTEVTETVDATCTIDGSVTVTCSVCGETLSVTPITALGHSYTSVVTAPTCTATGYTTYTCSRCSDTYTADVTATVPHTPGEWVVTVPATTTTWGTKEQHCTVCDALIASEQIPPIVSSVLVTGATGQAGQNVSVDIVMANNPGIWGFETILYYDRSLELTNVTLGNDFSSVMSTLVNPERFNRDPNASGNEAGRAALFAKGIDPNAVYFFKLYADANAFADITVNGVFFTATFKINGNAATGSYQVGVAQGYDIDLETGGTVINDAAIINAAGDQIGNAFIYGANVVEVAACPHSNTTTVTVDATCTVPGSVTVTCNSCGAIVYTTVLDVIAHDYAAVVTAPTCTLVGYTTYTCNACGASYTADETAALGHTEVTETVDATCTIDGSVTVTCSVCGETLSVTPITATGHSYTSVVTDPTCTLGGYTTYTCSVCSDTYTGDATAALDHDYYAAEVTAPTCTLGGYTTYTCSRCGDTYTADATEPTGHDAGEWVVTLTPTTTTTGTKELRCTVCGAVLDTAIIPVYTVPSFTVTDATANPGTTATVDIDLGSNPGLFGAALYVYYDANLVVTDILANGVFADSSLTTELNVGIASQKALATFAAAGVDTTGLKVTRIYLDNDALTNETLDGLFATLTFSIPGTLAAGEYTIGALAAEGEVVNVDGYTFAPVFNNGTLTVTNCQHPTTTTVTVDATCTVPGSVTVTCDVCGAIVSTTVLDVIAHDYAAVVTAPTCTLVGYTTYTCNACGASYTADETAALGHNEATVTIDATCTIDGSVTVTCLVCGETLSVTPITAPGHSYTSVVTAPTCTLGGYTTYTCSVCSDTYTGDATAALGHTEVTTTVDATCTIDGSVTVVCSVCGDTLSVTPITATGHSYTSVVTAPTCTLDGYTTYTCVACGDTYTDDVTAALGHTPAADWVITVQPTRTDVGEKTLFCTVCGAVLETAEVPPVSTVITIEPGYYCDKAATNVDNINKVINLFAKKNATEIDYRVILGYGDIVKITDNTGATVYQRFGYDSMTGRDLYYAVGNGYPENDAAYKYFRSFLADGTYQQYSIDITFADGETVTYTVKVTFPIALKGIEAGFFAKDAGFGIGNTIIVTAKPGAKEIDFRLFLPTPGCIINFKSADDPAQAPHIFQQFGRDTLTGRDIYNEVGGTYPESNAKFKYFRSYLANGTTQNYVLTMTIEDGSTVDYAVTVNFYS